MTTMLITADEDTIEQLLLVLRAMEGLRGKMSIEVNE